MNPGPTGHIPDALPTELSGLTRFNTNVINITMASVLPPSDHCYQGTGVDLIQHIAMLRGTPRLHNHQHVSDYIIQQFQITLVYYLLLTILFYTCAYTAKTNAFPLHLYNALSVVVFKCPSCSQVDPVDIPS